MKRRQIKKAFAKLARGRPITWRERAAGINDAARVYRDLRDATGSIQWVLEALAREAAQVGRALKDWRTSI